MPGIKRLMYVMLLGAMALIPTQAEAQLQFCNRTSQVVNIAISYPQQGSNRWTNEGWWVVQPGNCATTIGQRLGNRYYYFYAETNDRRTTWQGNVNGCVRSQRFRMTDTQTNCAERQVRFRRIDTNRNHRHTVNLNPVHGTGPAPSPTPPQTSYYGRETSSQVTAQRTRNLQGGRVIANATMTRNGNLSWRGTNETTAWTAGVRGYLLVKGYGRGGELLFVTPALNIPTSCGRADPGCPSRRTASGTERIPRDLAAYVSRLEIEIGARPQRDVFVRLTQEVQNGFQTIQRRCRDYRRIPPAAKATLVAYMCSSDPTFVGCTATAGTIANVEALCAVLGQ